MQASLERLMLGVIDYAGLFPPAKLSMHEAVESYCDYRSGPESWLISRFICPASRLMELEQELARVETECVPLSVVGTSGRDIGEFEAGLEKDVAEMNRFEDAAGPKCEIEAFEVRAPSTSDLEAVVRDLEGFGDIDVFVELPWDDGLHDGLVALAESEWLGAKARTGGADAAAFPSAEALSRFIRDCLNLDLPFKLTAGLHHPLRHVNRQIGVEEHGFLNVLCATAMAESHELNSAEIEAILLETAPNAFVFGESGFGWNDFGASIEDIESIRSLFVSIGSCSVDEPLDGLEDLGLLGVNTS